ncbi:TRAP transporter TatT component family protein [Candidatus Rariloculus sp.]|uniref:TRAP transporter TatT component family protein n=1 Tax=Candidatus Rariloculus sp. TaxID=3101265 RepID=UPI003D09A587
MTVHLAARSLAAGMLISCLLGGCTSMLGSIAAGTLSATILNQDDPALVESGVPAYMLLVDGMISQNPDNKDLLAVGAQLYALYGSRFEPEMSRVPILTGKARDYGQRAICLAHAPACDWEGMSYDAFVSALSEVDGRNIDYLYAYSVSWLSYLDATSEDWSAVAELPWVDAALERSLELDESYEQGALHSYLGIINALRPPALGGEPDVAQAHFERAIELSGGRDLSVKVEYARRYARLMFDQELHDRLLMEVLAAPVEMPGYTLFNVLAQREAEQLLASSREYF